MQNTLLVQTLSAFSPDERSEIRRFLADSYFNRSHHAKQILRLFTLLDDQIAQTKVAELSRDLLLREISPDKKASRGYFDNLMSELLALLRKFIWLQEADSEAAHNLATARFYRTRGLTDRAEQLLNRMPARPPRMAQPPRLQRFERELERSEIESSRNQRKGDLNLPAALEALTVFYSSQLLQLAAALYQQERLVPELNTDWAAFIEPFRASLCERQHCGEPVLALLDQAVQLTLCVSDDPEKEVAQFLEAMRAHESDLSEWTLKNLATYARNFCGYHIQRDRPGMADLLLTLYQEHLGKGWLYENGLLPASVLLNMLIIGLRDGQHKWVLKVLESHRGRVAGDDDQLVWHYCWARYHFRMGNFAEAEKSIMLDKQKQPDIEIEKSMRILSIEIAYERADLHLDSNLDAYTMFLRRNKSKLAPEKMEHNRHFIHTVKQMAQMRGQPQTPTRAKSIQALKSEVANPAYKVADRNWLLQKIAQL